ncbi:MAG: MBL fold metallo-hydrolase [Deltaproteobacteria bacterium]|nr:MAG: MBL fold metallo-hydrolase [Deltaproteobacteria bacterium]
MTKENKEKEKFEFPEELDPIEEGVVLPAEHEPDHPGWLSISGIMKISDPVFEKSMFLIGYGESSNVYVLVGDYLTIVDPGNDYTVFTELERLGFNPLDIKKVVVTHGHRDHCMGVFELLRFPPIYENKQIEIVNHEGGPLEFKKILEEQGFSLTQVRGGETLELSGFEWEVIHTPGHTIDGICLYNEATKTAITGDTVLPHAMADVDKNAGGRLDHYLYGLKQLLKKDIENILPGHGVPVAGDGRIAVEQTYEGVMMKVAEIEPESKTTWMEGATLLAEKGLLEEVVYCCDKELALKPGKLSSLQLKAFALNDMGRCEEAIEILDQILAEQGENVHALTAKGHALLGLQKFDESIKYFDQALAIDPEIKEAQVFKGMALYFMGKYDEAMDIEPFRVEFMDRFKDQIDKRQEEKKQDDNEPGGRETDEG